MAARRLGIVAVDDDVLSNQDIRTVDTPSIVNLSASSVTNGDTIGLRLNKTIILDEGECNTIAGDVIDVQTDRLVANSLVGEGQLKIPVNALTTELQLWIQVEPITDMGVLGQF